MEGHAKNCVEIYCELANKTTEQLYKVATPCMGDHQFEEEIVSRRIVYSLLTNCTEMSVFGSYWETWCFVVCEQTCSCGHKMDKILWQTLGAFDLVHSSYKWIPAMLLCGKHSTTLQIRIVSRLWFCRRTGGLEVNIRMNSVYFRKSHVCANKMDVQETDFSFTQFHRSWNHFSRCRFTQRRYSRSHSLDLVIEVFHSVPNRTDGPKREPWATHCGSSAVQLVSLHRRHSTTVSFHIRTVASQCCVVCLWGQWGSNQNVYQRSKNSNPLHWHQTSTRRHFEGNFTRDEWNNLHHLFNISHFSSTCCTKNFSLISCSTMAKRMQEQKGEERVVSKPRPAVNISLLLRQVSTPHRVRLHLKVRGCR